MNMSLHSKGRTSFLDIPLEILRQIYQYCLVRKDPISIYHIFINEYSSSECGIRDEKKSLLLVSKTVGIEALEVLYGDNVFPVSLHGEGEDFLKGVFSEANIGGLRKLQVIMQPQGISYGRPLDSTLWSPILAGLMELSIAVQPPLRAQPYYNGPSSFERKVEEWMEWVRTTLQYIARQLPSSCIVEADDDDRKESSSLIRNCFPCGHRMVQTLAGDRIFRRNDFFKELSYWDAVHYYHDVDYDDDSIDGSCRKT